MEHDDENDVSVMQLEEELQAIAQDFQAGKMQAFGRYHESILQSAAKIRETQVQLLLAHVELERRNPNIDAAGDESAFKENQFEPATKWFEQKSKIIQKLTSQLNSLAEQM